MKQIIVILFFLIPLGCQTAGESNSNKNLKAFNEYLGKDKADALNQVVQSFDEFLMTNYPNEESQKERIKAFLKQLSPNLEMDNNWVFNTEENKRIIQRLESSGMRQEIEIYGYEAELPNPYDSTLRFNIWGQYLTGLAKYAQDSIIQGYVSDRQLVGDINMIIIVKAYLNPELNYDNPLVKRMLVVDVYREVMKWDIEKNR